MTKRKSPKSIRPLPAHQLTAVVGGSIGTSPGDTQPGFSTSPKPPPGP